jgi:prepilin-type N-terminal cleavage/methylation domain-containing protein
MLRSFFSDSRGFTIRELIVALVVGSILVGYAFELYVFAQRIVTQWRKKAELSEVVCQALNRMTLDLQRGDEVETHGDSVYVVRADSRIVALYKMSGGMLARNDVRMNDPSSVALSVDIAKAGELVSVAVTGKSGSREHAASSKVLLTASSAGRFTRSRVLGSTLP